jgi:DNA-binding MarR family transcriptional regulator
MQSDAVDDMVAQWARSEPALDVGVLEVVGRLLRGAHLLDRAIVAALRPLELSYGDFDVLNTLRRRADPGGTNPVDLARSALITTGAMTSRLDRLERRGLIVRTPDPDDRRAVLIKLTRQGERLAVAALRAVLAADEAFLEPLSRRQRETVAAALRQLLRHHESI